MLIRALLLQSTYYRQPQSYQSILQRFRSLGLLGNQTFLIDRCTTLVLNKCYQISPLLGLEQYSIYQIEYQLHQRLALLKTLIVLLQMFEVFNSLISITQHIQKSLIAYLYYRGETYSYLNTRTRLYYQVILIHIILSRTPSKLKAQTLVFLQI